MSRGLAARAALAWRAWLTWPGNGRPGAWLAWVNSRLNQSGGSSRMAQVTRPSAGLPSSARAPGNAASAASARRRGAPGAWLACRAAAWLTWRARACLAGLAERRLTWAAVAGLACLGGCASWSAPYWIQTWPGALPGKVERVVVDRSPWPKYPNVRGWTVCNKEKRSCVYYLVRGPWMDCVEKHELEHVAGRDHPDYEHAMGCAFDTLSIVGGGWKGYR